MISIERSQIRARRTLLFVPGNALDKFPKAVATGSDLVCIDWEDAIAPQHKDQARAGTLDLLRNHTDCGRSEVLIRINALRTRDGLADVLALVGSTATPVGLMLPKVKSPDEIALLDDLLTGEDNRLRLHVIIETNAGLEACFEIARASPRIDSLVFGGIDMAAELRVEPVWDSLLYSRTRCVHAAATAEIDVIDVPFLDLDDADGLLRETEMSAAIGMTGKAAIHPDQLPVIKQVFTPSAEQLAHAKRIVAAFEAAHSGVVVVDNKLIERPVLRSMLRVLASADDSKT